MLFRSATSVKDGLDWPICGDVLLCGECDFMHEGTHKGFCTVFAMDLKIEGAKVASLPAEGDVEVEAEERRCHDKRLNPCGLEKSRARTISTSSSGISRDCVCAPARPGVDAMIQTVL